MSNRFPMNPIAPTSSADTSHCEASTNGSTDETSPPTARRRQGSWHVSPCGVWRDFHRPCRGWRLGTRRTIRMFDAQAVERRQDWLLGTFEQRGVKET